MTSDKQNKNSKDSCPKCGHKREMNDIECPKCGIIYEKFEKFQKKKAKEKPETTKKPSPSIETTKKPFTQGKKTFFRKKLSWFKNLFAFKEKFTFNFSLKYFLLIFLIASFLAGGYYYYSYQINKKEESIQKKKEYTNQLYFANYSMDSSISVLVEMCQEYSTEWRSAIKNDRSFDLAISRKQRFFEGMGIFENIDSAKNIVKNVIQELSQSKNLNLEAYNKIIDLYGVYSLLHALAKSPSGSLRSFNTEVSKLQNDYIRISNELKALLPENE